MFLSRTMTAPTLARLQVERSATWRVMVRKYWCQLSRSLIEYLVSGSLQSLAPLGRPRPLFARPRFGECKRNRHESHGERGEEKPADDFPLGVERRLGVDGRRMAHPGQCQDQHAPDDPAEPSADEAAKKQEHHRQ